MAQQLGEGISFKHPATTIHPTGEERGGGLWLTARGNWTLDRASHHLDEAIFLASPSSFWALALVELGQIPLCYLDCVNLRKWPNFSEPLVPYQLNENGINMFFTWLLSSYVTF